MQLHFVQLELTPEGADGSFTTTLGVYYQEQRAVARFHDLARQFSLHASRSEPIERERLWQRKGSIVTFPNLPDLTGFPSGSYTFNLYVQSKPVSDPERIRILDVVIYS